MARSSPYDSGHIRIFESCQPLVSAASQVFQLWEPSTSSISSVSTHPIVTGPLQPPSVFQASAIGLSLSNWASA